MSVHVGGHANLRVSELGRDILQALAVAQKQGRKRVARVVNAPTSNLCFVTGFPEHSVSPVVHIYVTSFGATQQTRFFTKLNEGAERLAALGGKADALGCKLLARELVALAARLEDAVLMQQRALSDRSLANQVGEELPFVLKK